jgi:hypothetical protein
MQFHTLILFCFSLSTKYLTINRSGSSVLVKLDNLSYSGTIIYNRTHLHLIQTAKHRSGLGFAKLGRYKHVNNKHLTHLSKINGIQFPPPNSIMTRGFNHGRHLQSAAFRGCVACSGSTCNRQVFSLGCTTRPQSPQKETTNASVRAR